MRIALSGAGGLLGSAAAGALRARGDEVLRLVRREAKAADEISWDPAHGPRPADALAGLDALVHLAGAGIADRPWTAARRRELVSSRVASTARLAEAVAAGGPRVMVVASAVGFYGDRGEEPLDETAAAGQGFLADLVRDWENAAEPARAAGARTVHLRFGVVLTPRGGALARMLPAFRLGLGARLGRGDQYFAWVSQDDAVAAILAGLDGAALAGPVNVVAPEAVTNREYTAALGKALRRPAPFAAPAWVLRLVLDGLAEEGLLASQRVVPARLQAAGFAFRDPELAGALQRMLA